jgi:hypothetical protein
MRRRGWTKSKTCAVCRVPCALCLLVTRNHMTFTPLPCIYLFQIISTSCDSVSIKPIKPINIIYPPPQFSQVHLAVPAPSPIPRFTYIAVGNFDGVFRYAARQ